MDRFNTCIASLKGWFDAHQHNFVAGLLMACWGYFAEVQSIFAVIFAAIMIDLITGIWASRVEGKGITSKRLIPTIKKVALYFGVIALVFAIDKEFEMVELHKFIAWVIVGFEVYSILENGARITDHPIFRMLKRFMADKIKTNTGVDIDEKEDK